jgi:hypothetical protein
MLERLQLAHTLGSAEVACLSRSVVDHRTAVTDLAGRVAARVVALGAGLHTMHHGG